MKEKRVYGAAAYHPDVGFLITGGYDGDNYLSSTEVTKDGQSFQVKTFFTVKATQTT